MGHIQDKGPEVSRRVLCVRNAKEASLAGFYILGGCENVRKGHVVKSFKCPSVPVNKHLVNPFHVQALFSALRTKEGQFLPL